MHGRDSKMSGHGWRREDRNFCAVFTIRRIETVAEKPRRARLYTGTPSELCGMCVKDLPHLSGCIDCPHKTATRRVWPFAAPPAILTRPWWGWARGGLRVAENIGIFDELEVRQC
jgi:hypothetical protein